MLNYNDIYEILRKEKYSEPLQPIQKSFLADFASFLHERKSLNSDDMLSESAMKNKKQLENSLSLFRELVLRRKKKLLNLVFVAAETGIMKRDYDNMLDFEKQIFEKLVKAFEEGDKELARTLQGSKNDSDVQASLKMILFNENVEQFVDMTGNVVGPFNSGQIANLDGGVSEILVSSGKASFIDA